MQQQEQQHSYWRSDITGLRALAVLPVLIFHAWPALLPGGFVGVDVFFVISGYLISGILFRQLQRTGHVDFADFYAKRIRRIIPNLLCVLLFTAVVGWFFLTPSEYHDLGKQIYSSAFFYQNFRLLKDLGDYFATDASLQPLLHLWSLAIEEQFYIVFPLLCALVWKLRTNVRALGVTVLLVTVGSLAACLLVKDQTFRFYFPLTRFWELGVGILLSYAQHFGFWRPDTQTSLKRNTLSLLGGGLLVISLFVVREQNFPGVEALLPTVGAVLILAASPKAKFNRFLAWSPIVFIGLISYSLYLWHWPLLAYANVIYPLHEAWINGVLLVAAFVLSLISYRYVETPCRTVRIPSRKKMAVVGLIGGVLLAVVGGQVIRRTDGVPQRSSTFIQKVELRHDWQFPRKIFEKATWNGAEILVNKPGVFPSILFVGDSHMEQYAVRLKKIANEKGISMGWLVHGGCLIAPGVRASSRTCAKRNEDYLKIVDDPRIKTVVMGQMWGGYKHNDSDFVEVNGRWVSLQAGGFEQALRNVAERFSTTVGKRKLIVLFDVPWDSRSYDPLPRINRLDPAPLEKKSFDVPLPRERDWSIGNETVREILGPVSTIIDPLHQVCPNDTCNLLNYKDANHLRASYVIDHAVWIDSVFDDIKGVPDES